MPPLSALRTLSIGTLLGPQLEKDINWYLHPEHTSALLIRLTPQLDRVGQIVLHIAFSVCIDFKCCRFLNFSYTLNKFTLHSLIAAFYRLYLLYKICSEFSLFALLAKKKNVQLSCCAQYFLGWILILMKPPHQKWILLRFCNNIIIIYFLKRT